MTTPLRGLAWLALGLLLPNTALSLAIVHRDSCRVDSQGGAEIHFSVSNLGTDAPICAVRMLPAGGPSGSCSIGGCRYAGVLSFESSFSAGHTHSISIRTTEIDVPPVVGRTYQTTVSGGHSHTVVLSASELTALQQPGAIVTVSSSMTGGHTHLFSIQRATVWHCDRDAGGGAAWTGTGACIAPAGTESGFSLSLDAAACCFQVEFTTSNGGFRQEECFDCSVATARSTWSGLKRLYQ